jgi:hypothetical protein
MDGHSPSVISGKIELSIGMEQDVWQVTPERALERQMERGFSSGVNCMYTDYHAF